MLWLPVLVASLPTVAPPLQRGALATAAHVEPERLVLDGDPQEWAAGGADVVIDRPGQFVELSGRAGDELWSGPEDAALELWVGWNAADLIVGGVVRDQAADHDEVRWYQGDGIELFLGNGPRDGELELEGDWGPDDWQLMLAPNWPERTWGVYPRSGQTRGRVMGSAAGASHAGFGGVEVASVPIADGYRFEARVPWVNLAPLEVLAGRELAFNVALCDRDGAGPRPGTSLESYGTWTGERDLARVADRRGRLRLAPPGDEAAGGAHSGPPARTGRPLVFLGLAAVYGLALWTRRVWRRPRARLIGLAGAVVFVALAFGVAWLLRTSAENERATRRRELTVYWAGFEELLRAGALGHPEPAALVEDVEALLSGRGVAPVFPGPIAHLAPRGARLLGIERTARRGISFRPFALAEPEADDVDPASDPASPDPEALARAVDGAGAPPAEPSGPSSPGGAEGARAVAGASSERARPADGRGVLLGPGDELAIPLRGGAHRRCGAPGDAGRRPALFRDGRAGARALARAASPRVGPERARRAPPAGPAPRGGRPP